MPFGDIADPFFTYNLGIGPTGKATQPPRFAPLETLQGLFANTPPQPPLSFDPLPGARAQTPFYETGFVSDPTLLQTITGNIFSPEATFQKEIPNINRTVDFQFPEETTQETNAAIPRPALPSSPFQSFPRVVPDYPEAPSTLQARSAIASAEPIAPPEIDTLSYVLKGLSSGRIDPSQPFGFNLLNLGLSALGGLSNAKLAETERSEAFGRQQQEYNINAAKALADLNQQEFLNQFNLAGAETKAQMANIDAVAAENEQLRPRAVSGGVLFPKKVGDRIQYEVVPTQTERKSNAAIFSGEAAASDPKAIFTQFSADPDFPAVFQQFMEDSGENVASIRGQLNNPDDITIRQFITWMQQNIPQTFMTNQALARQNAIIKALSNRR